MDIESLIVYIKTNDIYKDIAEDVETNYELERPLPKIKNNKVIGLTKDKLCEKIMKEFARMSNST